jgi:hypothetical protein
MTNKLTYTDDTIIIDHQTGLEWQATPLAPMSWDAAMAMHHTDGWRIPTREEVFSLRNHIRLRQPQRQLRGALSPHHPAVQ